MYKQLLFLFALGIGLLTQAQTVITPDWVKTKSSSTGGNAEGWGVDVDNSGAIYWPVNVDSTNQGLDVVCYKYDASGNSIWSTPFFYGGPGAQQSYVCNAKGSDLYIGGRFCTGLVNTCNMMLLKVNPLSGNLVWDKTFDFGNNGYDEVDGLVVKDDGIYCGGWAQALQTGAYQSDIGLWKLDFNGNTIWTNSFGQAGTAEHQDGHFIVDDNVIYAAGLWGGGGVANLYNGYSFLGTFSKQNGNFIDSTLYGYQSSALLDIENALGMASDGTFLYVTGYSTPVATNDWQIFVAKFDKSLNQIWIRDWGDSGTESARGIAVHNGRIYIAGLTESTTLSQGGGQDGLLLQYDTDGTFISAQTWGDSQDNSFRDIAINDASIYLSGSSQDNSVGTNRSAFLLALPNPTTSIDQNDNPEFIGLKSFPNPAQGNVQIKWQNPNKVGGLVKVSNLHGQTFSQSTFTGDESSLKLVLPHSGVFLITVVQGSNSSTLKVLNWP